MIVINILMNKCSRCDIILYNSNDNNVNSKNILVKYKNEIVCNPCFEAISFMNDLNSPITSKKNNNENKIVDKNKIIYKNQSKIECSNINCKYIYVGSICPKCKVTNILFVKKKKKKKKRKKKKE